MSSTWDKVMELGKKNDKRHFQGQNNLKTHEIDTILATIHFFGGQVTQDLADLATNQQQVDIAKRVVFPLTPRYKVYDWLAMRVQGRHSGEDADKQATKVLAHAFIKSKGDVDKFVEDLRVTDYDIDDSWQKIEL